MTKRALFLTNGGHSKLPNNQELLEDVLVRQAGLELRQCDDPEELNSRLLASCDLIVDYSGHAKKEPTDAQLELVMVAVQGGMPYVGLHVASLPFRSQLDYVKAHGGRWPDSPRPNHLLGPSQLRYLEMVGSVFITHGPIEPFTVHIVDPEHPVTRGVDDFEIVDELYILGGNRSRLQVLAEAGGQPLVYVTEWGKGRVYYNALGHDHRALANPGYQRLLAQGVAWALGSAS